jgi:hypothetical protein
MDIHKYGVYIAAVIVAIFVTLFVCKRKGLTLETVEPITSPSAKIKDVKSADIGEGLCDYSQPRYKGKSPPENKCRCFLERHYGVPFPSTRDLDWLVNTTGYRLEIDCYNECLRLGVEYNGRQHLEFVPKFHKTIHDLERQKERDALKNKLCEENGVTLITVPHYIGIDDIDDYIRERLPVHVTNVCNYAY